LNNKAKAHIALLLTNIFFAINLSAVKYLTINNYVKPFGLNVIRVGVSMLLFWLLFLFKPAKAAIQKKDIPAFLLCALTGVAINQMLFIKGLSLTFSIHAVLLMLTTPILITLFAAWVLNEKITPNKVFGLLLGITGAVVLIMQKQNTGSGENILLGDILILINAISYSVYFILVKPLMQQYNPINVIRWVFTLGFFMVLPFGLSEFNEINWQSFSSSAISNLLLIVVGGTFLAYLLNVYGIKIVGASIAGAYIYSQPFFAAAIAMVFLHERLEAYKIIAAVLIFAGVFIANKKTRNA
jgi:drug/metabolite transporter (DMT)-like permease